MFCAYGERSKIISDEAKLSVCVSGSFTNKFFALAKKSDQNMEKYTEKWIKFV